MRGWKTDFDSAIGPVYAKEEGELRLVVFIGERVHPVFCVNVWEAKVLNASDGTEVFVHEEGFLFAVQACEFLEGGEWR